MVFQKLQWFGGALAAMFAAALLLHPALRLRRGRRLGALLVLAGIILLAPLLVPSDARFLRLLAAVFAVISVLKLYDLHRGARLNVRPTGTGLVVFLFNIFSLVHRNLVDQPRPDVRRELWRFATGSVACLGALYVAYRVFGADWTAFGFWPEHAAKVVAFFFALFPFTRALGAAWRLAGLPGRDFMNNPFASRTPADFWRRYNRPVHEFLDEDVFKPAARPPSPRGGRRGAAPSHRFRAALFTFLVSAAVHEYVFTIPVGRVQGYQTAFFLIQGLAVALSLRQKPRGWAAVPWVVGTLTFNVVSGVLFFASLNQVVRFYQNRPPLWDEPAGARVADPIPTRRPW